MSFIVSGLPVEQFRPLFGLPDNELKKRGIIRKTADIKPGYPCRVTLEDAAPGESVLLFNYESHKAQTPYRSSFAIYVREEAQQTRTVANDLPPALRGRPIALRIFDKDGMLIGADLDLSGGLPCKINQAFKNPNATYIHAHNAMHGCFAAEINRAS